jgi:hypothetical protein
MSQVSPPQIREKRELIRAFCQRSCHLSLFYLTFPKWATKPHEKPRDDAVAGGGCSAIQIGLQLQILKKLNSILRLLVGQCGSQLSVHNAWLVDFG